ncbi:hypothetical protein [Paenibacillus oleatilyticus]|uniref:Phage protein n=1 Tax=Paenibacillus oleatilyticus TaxID=2594886 RepID=A0ABV4VCE0_9BACL
MKQRITIEQLNELTDEQKERLQEWWSLSRQPGDIHINSAGYVDIINKYGDKPLDNTIPLLSIGQMIELTSETTMIKFNGGWGIGEDAIKYHDELCDALWEAVKEVLR